MDFKSIEEVESLSLYEYGLLMKAYGLKRIDKERDIHLQAFINQVAKSTKRVGKKEVPVYRKFKDLYDAEEREKQVLGITKPQDHRMARLVLQANNL